jgi:hypothetical protein
MSSSVVQAASRGGRENGIYEIDAAASQIGFSVFAKHLSAHISF